jgi:hypothetical protein
MWGGGKKSFLKKQWMSVNAFSVSSPVVKKENV